MGEYERMLGERAERIGEGILNNNWVRRAVSSQIYHILVIENKVIHIYIYIYNNRQGGRYMTKCPTQLI